MALKIHWRMGRTAATKTTPPPLTGRRRPPDLALLLATRVLRAFGFGFGALLLGVHLERRGLSPGQIGLTLTIGLAAGSLLALALAAAAGRMGRRRALALAGVGMAVTGLDLAAASQPPLLVLAGVTGMLGAAGLDLGPFSAVEQALLSESVEVSRRNRAFGRYSLSGALAGAAGATVAALGMNLHRSQLLFGLFALIGLATAILPLQLSMTVEGARSGNHLPAFRPIAGLAGLFALDALGGGFVVNSIIAYWLHVHFGAAVSVLGPAFSALALLQAASYEVSGRLADRFGRINTMVFTHLPSNVLLMLVPLSPTLWVAVALLAARFAISQMDVPARQAFVVSIVPPAQREGAVAVTGALRGVAQAFGPVLSGILIQVAAFGMPFYAAGGLKIVYDLALFTAFRRHEAKIELT